MKKITKEQDKQRADFSAELTIIAKKIQDAVGKANDAISEANDAISEYNAKLSEADEFRNEVVGAIEEYIDERSEKWLESEAASNYSDWKGEWEGAEMSEVSELDTIDDPDLAHDETLDQLPSEPSSS